LGAGVLSGVDIFGVGDWLDVLGIVDVGVVFWAEGEGWMLQDGFEFGFGIKLFVVVGRLCEEALVMFLSAKKSSIRQIERDEQQRSDPTCDGDTCILNDGNCIQ